MYGVENFSLWCDFIERDFLKGEFIELLDKKVFNGATSNPSIFKSAFLTSPAYQDDKAKLKGLDSKEVYEKLAIEDIKRAATTMENLYHDGNDGFISIEVDPMLCDDANGTIKEGKRLFKEIGKKNVMIKVPATDAGYIAMEELMRSGINVNATLIFSPAQAKGCMDAFQRAKNSDQKGVVSVFVSRFDGKLDKQIETFGMKTAKIGIYNATKIYDLIESYELPNVRTLFASTGVKSEDLETDYYIKELLFKNAVNTAPLGTIKAFINSKAVEKTPTKEYEEYFKELEKYGLDMQKAYDELLQDGLKSFKEAFAQILKEL